MFRISILVVISVLVFLPLGVLAAGIAVEPASLELSGTVSQPVSAQLVVSNPSGDVEVFEVYADDLPEQFVFTPRSFTLEAGATKTVKVQFSPAQKQAGKFQGNLSVLAHPLTQEQFQANSGVKIPFVYTSLEGKSVAHREPVIFYIAALLYGLVVAAMLVSLIYHFRQRRKNKHDGTAV